MINIAICDDDKNISIEIQELINSTGNPQIYNIVVFDNGMDFFKSNFSNYDIVFLDIEIGDMSGIELAVELRKVNGRTIIFFITNHARYISEALKSMPFQYLLKPISEQRALFFEEFNRGLRKLKKIKQIMRINTLYGEEYVQVDSIKYIEYLNKNIVMHTNEKTVVFVGKLNEWLTKLMPYDFIQCHKSFIVNLNYIEKIKFNNVILKNDVSIPIGRKYAQNLKDARNIFLAGVNI